MSEIAELRKLFQDLIAPDMQALKANVKNMQTSVDHGFAAAVQISDARHRELLAQMELIELRTNAKIDQVNSRMLDQFKLVEVQLAMTEQKINVLSTQFEFDKRLAKIESERESKVA